ncbi:MAG: hypothetical protein ABI318_03285, partial [Chthoniobacteraceae bacterium]
LRGNAVHGVNEYIARPKYIEGQHMPFKVSESWAEKGCVARRGGNSFPLAAARRDSSFWSRRADVIRLRT